MNVERVAIVSGTGGPVDHALIEAFGEEKVFVELVEHKGSSIPAFSNRVVVKTIDIANEEEVRLSVNSIVEKRQKIDYLVTCPDLRYHMALIDFTDQQWEDSFKTNLTSVFLMCKHVVPIMIKQQSGKIVHLVSDAARTGAYKGAPYAASKASVIGFSKSLSREVASFGITVNVISVGLIGEGAIPFRQDLESNTIPLSRVGQWEEVANMVLCLLSGKTSYITGQTLHVNGGLFMP